jgi:hypothetical protein
MPWRNLTQFRRYIPAVPFKEPLPAYSPSTQPLPKCGSCLLGFQTSSIFLRSIKLIQPPRFQTSSIFLHNMKLIQPPRFATSSAIWKTTEDVLVLTSLFKNVCNLLVSQRPFLADITAHRVLHLLQRRLKIMYCSIESGSPVTCPNHAPTMPHRRHDWGSTASCVVGSTAPIMP